MTQNISHEMIEIAIARLADPRVNTAIQLASTSYVTKQIIEGLPGVKELASDGPEVEEAMLQLIAGEESRQRNLTAIALYILGSYKSERVKLTLARMIVSESFTGVRTQLAAESFLKAARIDYEPEDAIRLARHEAHQLVSYADEQISTKREGPEEEPQERR